MSSDREERINASWNTNAEAWTNAIGNKEIDSRNRVTNAALLERIQSLSVSTMLDIGCGEGWLVRQVTQLGIEAVGIDGSGPLIEQAKSLSEHTFEQVLYEDLATKRFNMAFDLAVCNFSLLGCDSVEKVFKAVPALLTDNGHLMVQTLHPVVVSENALYKDGWRDGSWAGFSAAFVDPAPWYFRTIESWVSLFVSNGFKPPVLTEPVDPLTNRPASLIMTARISPK